MEAHEPLKLTSLGFRKHPLDRSLTTPLPHPFPLELKQLRAVIWFVQKVFHHKAKLHNQEVSGLGQSRDWLCGGIVADPPGMGKTVMAIAFCLVSKKLGFLDLPTYVFVKSSIANQYVNEIHCFVNVDAVFEVMDLTGSSFTSKKLTKFLKQDKSRWLAGLICIGPSKMSVPKKESKSQASFILTHSSNLWVLVLFDKVQHMASYSMTSFLQKFNINCQFTIGLSATPI